MHALAFVAGLVLSGVAAMGFWTAVPSDGATWFIFGTALSVAILALGLGYGLYLTLMGLLLNLDLGWGYYLLGPVIVLAVMGLVFALVYAGVLTVGQGSIGGYALLFVIGGVIMVRRAALGAEDAA
ncbi:hypothetical protein [Sagittula sp. SSi028]|uniref:hypothetical protein n=1 Tax=Sagittula sp. SSi028 TaxID=3400636 RepID=UPI003AF57B1C